MNNKLNKIIAKLSAGAMIISTLAVSSPVSAAEATVMSDTLTREKISVTSVGHTVSLVLPGAGIVDDGSTLTLDYNTSGFAAVSAVPVAACTGGDATASTTANVITVIADTADCTGTLTLTFTATNPGSNGSKKISLAGTAGITGQYAIPIVDEDTITVTATVDPSITFDLSAQTAACTYGSLANTYLVALGTLSTGSVSSSDAASVQAICVQLDTNAANGAVVTVKQASPGAAGTLASTSVPTDVIPANTGDVDAGTSEWGMCGNLVSRATTVPAGEFEMSGAGQDDWGGDQMIGTAGGDTSTTCTSVLHGTTTAFDGTTQSVLDTNTSGVGQGLARFLVKASISGTQPAHTDYTATLTWIATGTF